MSKSKRASAFATSKQLSEIMIFGLFRGSANRKLIDRLHRELIDAARDPVLFTDYGIADTLEGRFEALVLHGTLV